jgi:hypothetical protein
MNSRLFLAKEEVEGKLFAFHFFFKLIIIVSHFTFHSYSTLYHL